MSRILTGEWQPLHAFLWRRRGFTVYTHTSVSAYTSSNSAVANKLSRQVVSTWPHQN